MDIQKTFLINSEDNYILEPLLSNYSEVEEKENKYIVGFYHDKKIYVDILFLNGRNVSRLNIIDRVALLENWFVFDVYPTVLRWVLKGSDIYKFLDIQKEYNEFLIRDTKSNIISSINRDYVTCKKCGYTFDYLSILEAEKDYILCPSCFEPVTQNNVKI